MHAPNKYSSISVDIMTFGYYASVAEKNEKLLLNYLQNMNTLCKTNTQKMHANEWNRVATVICTNVIVLDDFGI